MVISAAAKTGKLQKAEEWFEKAAGAGFEPQVVSYNSVIAAAAVRGKLADAERWFHRLQASKLSPSRITYKTLMNAASKAGDVEAAERWFLQMQASGLDADAISYNILIDAAMRCRDVGAGKKRYHEMIANGLNPDIFTFGALIALADAVGDPDLASNWAAEAREWGIRLSRSCYGPLLKLHCNQGDLQSVEAVLADMKRDKLVPDVFMFNGVLEAYARTGREREAAETLEHMVAKGVSPSEATLAVIQEFPFLETSAARLQLKSYVVSDSSSRRAQRLDRNSDKWTNARNQEELANTMQ